MVGTNLFRPERPATPDISTTPICKKSLRQGLLSDASIADLSSGDLYRCSGANIKGCVMKILFSRWVGVDSVAPAPDYLDRQNADCGGASRFYRRGVAFRFQNRRAPSQSRYGTSRRCRPGLDHQSLALSMIRPAPPTSAVVNFSSAAEVSLKSTVRISAGQNRSWRGTLTSASAMRSVMERFTPMKLCIRQSRDGDGKFVSTERLRFVTQLYEYNRPTAWEASENLFRIAISHASCWLLPLIDGKKIML